MAHVSFELTGVPEALGPGASASAFSKSVALVANGDHPTDIVKIGEED